METIDDCDGSVCVPCAGTPIAACTPTDDGREIAEAAIRLLARAELEGPVRLLGVSVTRLCPDAAGQLALLEDRPGRERRRRLNRVIDDVRARFGAESLASGTARIERAGLSLQIKRGE